VSAPRQRVRISGGSLAQAPLSEAGGSGTVLASRDLLAFAALRTGTEAHSAAAEAAGHGCLNQLLLTDESQICPVW
jgi:hypothetical protein